MNKDKLRMIDSYIEAIDKAGGSSKMFLKSIETMTVMEMIDILAPNDVRFKCIKGEVENGTEFYNLDLIKEIFPEEFI